MATTVREDVYFATLGSRLNYRVYILLFPGASWIVYVRRRQRDGPCESRDLILGLHYTIDINMLADYTTNGIDHRDRPLHNGILSAGIPGRTFH